MFVSLKLRLFHFFPAPYPSLLTVFLSATLVDLFPFLSFVFLLLEDLYVTVFPEPRIPNLISLLKTLRTPLTRQARWVSSLHVGKARGFDGAGDEKEGTMLFSKSLSPQMPQRRVPARSFLFPWHSAHKHNS